MAAPVKPGWRVAACAAALIAGAGAAAALRSAHRMDAAAAAVAAWAVPAPPDLAGWPDGFARRLRAETDAAHHGHRPYAALTVLARLYHANDCYPEAGQVERGLATLEPNRALWAWLLADACANLGDEAGACSNLEKTVVLDAHYAPAQLKLADLYLKRNELPQASVHYQLRLELVPLDPYAMLGLARIAQQTGDAASARRILERLLRSTPHFYSAQNLLAEICDQMGDRAEAARAREGVRGKFEQPADPWLTQLYAWSFDSFYRSRAGLSGPAHVPLL